MKDLKLNSCQRRLSTGLRWLSLSKTRILFCIVCVLIAVIANFFGSVLARNITLPLYLDSVLTLAVTALCGLWAGIACAVLSNGALWIFYNTSLPFTLCHILTAVCAYFTFRKYKIPKQSDRNNASGKFGMTRYSFQSARFCGQGFGAQSRTQFRAMCLLAFYLRTQQALTWILACRDFLS